MALIAEDIKKKVRLVVATLAALVSLAVPVWVIPLALHLFPAVNDLPEYYAAATLALSGKGAGIYDLSLLGAEQHRLFPAMGQRVVGLFIPPFSLPLLLPVALLPVNLAPVLWMGLLALATAASCVLLRKIFNLSKVATLWTIALLSLSGPLFEVFHIGQLAPFLLLSFCGTLLYLARGQDTKAGFALVLLLLKPQEILPVLLYLTAAKKWKPVAIVAGTAAVLGALSFVLVGMEGWRNYFKLVGDSTNVVFMQPELSSTVRGQLMRIPGLSPQITSVTSIVALVVVSGIIGYSGWRLRGSLRGLLFIAVPLGLLSSLHCHDYDLLLLTPSVIALTKFPPAAKMNSLVAMTALLSSGIIMLPIYIIVHYQWLLTGGVVNPQFIVLLFWAVCLAVFAFRHLNKEHTVEELRKLD